MIRRIEVLVTRDCPHAGDTWGLVSEVAERLAPDAAVALETVSDAEAAVRLEFPGSPTVRVDGRDVEGTAIGPPALACRTYRGSGVPPRWLIEAAVLRALRPKHVLFLCVANSARSQMAEGIGRRAAPSDVRISSAGSEPSRVRPLAVRALAETGIDASSHRSKSVDELAGERVDCVITLCADENCPLWLGDAWRVHWALPDPAAVEGTEQEKMEAFREVREELRRRLEALFG